MEIDYEPSAQFFAVHPQIPAKPVHRTIGVYFRIRTAEDPGSWADRVTSGAFDVTMDELYGWHDPAIGIERIYATNTAAILWSNMSHYSNPEVDALFRSASAEKDPEGRKALYAALQERLSREHVALWLCTIPLRHDPQPQRPARRGSAFRRPFTAGRSLLETPAGIMDKASPPASPCCSGFSASCCARSSFSLLQLLKMLSEEADRNRQRRFCPTWPSLPTSARGGEWAKGILHDSILCRDRFVHLGVVRKSRPAFSESVLESLEALAVDPGVKEKIKNNLNELDGIACGLNQAVAQRIDNLRNTERLVKRIRTLNADLPQLEQELYASGMKPGDPGFNVWKTAYSDVLTAMLLLSMHHDRPYSLRLKAKSAPTSNGCCARRRASPFPGV